MTGPHDSPDTRPISVAELLAKNGTIGAPPPVSGRRRRRRGNSDAVTVAELTGEIPIVSDDVEHDETERRGPGTHAQRANGAAVAPVVEKTDHEVGEAPYWSALQPRWPESPQQHPRESRPERSPYPLPVRNSARIDDRAEAPDTQPGAEEMSPDPLEDYAGMPVDVMDTEVREAEPANEDSAYVRSYLRRSVGLFSGRTTAPGVEAEPEGDSARDDVTDADEADEDYPDLADADTDLTAEVADAYPSADDSETMLRGGLVVLQSILAVAFGAGLFIAFDQLWRWNNIVA
ncbi:MAG: hypothetical protein ACRDTS_19535, partial [Mycobacterium sp.]